MANLREGKFGEYYGSFYNESVSLTNAEMKKNAAYIFSALTFEGWTPEAIAGLLGNMQHESAINPGRWQSNKVGAMSSGYSLVQWTPATKYIDWCTSQGFEDPSEMDNALARILYEVENNIQYYATSSYPLSFKEFTQSTQSPYDLACAFAWNYERSWTVLYGTAAQKEALRKKRGGAAETWYKYLTGLEPVPPSSGGSTAKKGKQLSLLMMYVATKGKF